jgi:hypothetical protein
MSALNTAILVAWLIFWIYWLIAAGVIGLSIPGLPVRLKPDKPPGRSDPRLQE